jgi:hypothetical protein
VSRSPVVAAIAVAVVTAITTIVPTDAHAYALEPGDDTQRCGVAGADPREAHAR